MTPCDCVEGCQLADRFTPATRELMVFTKNPKRYFDLDAVREPFSEATRQNMEKTGRDNGPKARSGDLVETYYPHKWQMTHSGAPPLDWWQIPSPKPLPVTEYQGAPMTAIFYVGDAIETMNKLPEKSVDLILTSPPFLALRSYLPADHPDKALEGGSQATPGAFIDWLVDVVEACDRVLAPHGSLCIELGDTYAGSGGAGGDYNADGLREGQPKFRNVGGRGDGRKGHTPLHKTADAHMVPPNAGTGWPLAKSLSLIPELFRLTLVYGTNPLTGRQTDRWRLRNVVRWVRPNPPVGALGDKFRPATSELMVFCKSAKRYFDLDAVRGMEPEKPHGGWPLGKKYIDTDSESRFDRYDRDSRKTRIHEAGAPPLDWWNIPLLEGEEEPGPCDKCQGASYAGPGWIPCDGSNHPDHEACGDVDIRGFNGPYMKCPSCGGSGIKGATRYGPKEPPKAKNAGPLRSRAAASGVDGGDLGAYWAPGERMELNPLGAPPLDWWNIPPGGFSGAHYAVFPPELCIKPIKAMCPERVCRHCGEPSRRIVEATRVTVPDDGTRVKTSGNTNGWEPPPELGWQYHRTTVGWSDCSCTQGELPEYLHDQQWRPGLVLDPFGGSGTTALVATGHGRDCILIDLDPRNFDLALDRVGPFILERGTI